MEKLDCKHVLARFDFLTSIPGVPGSMHQQHVHFCLVSVYSFPTSHYKGRNKTYPLKVSPTPYPIELNHMVC